MCCLSSAFVCNCDDVDVQVDDNYFIFEDAMKVVVLAFLRDMQLPRLIAPPRPLIASARTCVCVCVCASASCPVDKDRLGR